MKKLSYNQIILKYLEKNSTVWFKSFELEKTWLDGLWVGPSAARRLREMAANGLIEVKHGKYAEYRAKEIVKPQRPVQFEGIGTLEMSF